MHLKSTLFCLFLSLAAVPAFAEDIPNQWYGRVADRELMKLAPESDFIADSKTWKDLWNKWSPDEAVPEVEFNQHLVVVATVSGPNRMFGNENVDEQGNLTFKVGSTRMAGPGFAYLMRRVSRKEVKTVNGHTVPALDESMAVEEKSSETNRSEDAGDSITINIVGTLETGVMAIGGETTGTTITANGITFELDLSGDAKMAKLAEELKGKRAVAVGALRREQGVERGARWIVTVKNLHAAQTPVK